MKGILLDRYTKITCKNRFLGSDLGNGLKNILIVKILVLKHIYKLFRQVVRLKSLGIF